MNRIDRISAILIQLQSRRVVKASDIAARFNISLRTVYRDVKTLEEAGIPIIGEAGVGYSIMDGYRLPPIMFTREEATAFLTAEKFVEKLTDASTSAQHKSAMYKIRAILKSAEKDLLENMDENIAVIKSRPQSAVNNNDHIQHILNAIAAKNILEIEYTAGYTQQLTRRKIEPVGIFYLDSYWHLIAYCQMRNDYRDFRCDRIQSLNQLSETFTGKHPTLKAYIDQTAHEKHLETIVIDVENELLRFISEQKYYQGFVSEKCGRASTEMTFLAMSIEGFARWYLTFGDMARVVSPPQLKERIIALSKQTLDRNSK